MKVATPVKIYTRTGDGGSTGLFGGPRVAKDDARIEAYGTVDELNAFLGLVRSCGLDSGVDEMIERIQNELFSIGAELATPNPDEFNLRVIGSDHIERLEHWIDESEAGLPPLKNFILPSGTPAATHIHVARATCRRAERRLVTLQQQNAGSVSEDLLVYLNRLSDLLFVLARRVNAGAGVSDHPWEKPTI